MKGLQDKQTCSTVSSYRLRFKILVVISACMLFAFGMSACNANVLSSTSAASIARASTTSNPAGYPVKVFFSRFPQSVTTKFSAVYPVERMSPTIAVGTFALTLDKKGTFSQTGTATVKFCRSVISPGIGADARVTAEINATLKQFPRIKQVVILTEDGHCFADLSGKDLCLK